jgi:hypothetical protein
MADTSGTRIRYLSPEKLEPHPLNDDIYGDREDPDEGLIASIEEHGIIEPVVADPQADVGADEKLTIISGHRRVEAAKEIGLDSIPVREVRLKSDLDRREQLLAFNKDRDKNFSQKLREAEALERIEKERALRRQGSRTDIVENSSQGDEEGSGDGNFGKTRDIVAEKADIGSGRTYDKAKTVWEASQEGDTVAQHEVSKLDRGQQSISGAYDKVRERVEKATNSTGDNDVTSSSGGDESDKDAPDKQVPSEDIILSAHVGNNDEVFYHILELHIDPGSAIADVTYGNGTFWKKVPSGKYDLTATDLDPSKSPDTTEGVDCRDLPYDDSSFDCLVLDPPYAEGFYASDGKPSDNDYWIKDRYTGESADHSETYHEAVLEMYAQAGREAYRVLREDGILIAKMQDEVSQNEQRFTHIEITEIYKEIGYHPKDLFVVVRPDRPYSGNTHEQRHARKNHSYFMIYEMPNA